MQKVGHGGNLTRTVSLGDLWDMPENESRDCAPGTFAELIRYGAVHFRQKRRGLATLKAKKPKTTMNKKLLEP